MSGHISEEDVLEPYNNYLNNFNDVQQKYWQVWSYLLPNKIVTIRNGISLSNKNIKFWRNYSYISIILSAIIPIIVDIFKEILNWSNFAVLLDAVFPALVVIIQKKIESWSKTKTVYASVATSYDRLLWDMIIDIDRNEYSDNIDIHKEKWEKLDQILNNAELA